MCCLTVFLRLVSPFHNNLDALNGFDTDKRTYRAAFSSDRTGRPNLSKNPDCAGSLHIINRLGHNSSLPDDPIRIGCRTLWPEEPTAEWTDQNEKRR